MKWLRDLETKIREAHRIRKSDKIFEKGSTIAMAFDSGYAETGFRFEGEDLLIYGSWAEWFTGGYDQLAIEHRGEPVFSYDRFWKQHKDNKYVPGEWEKKVDGIYKKAKLKLSSQKSEEQELVTCG